MGRNFERGVGRLLAAAVALVVSVTSAGAQEGGALDLERRLELLGHRALAAVRASPDAVLSPFATDGCSGGLSTVWAFVAETLPDFAEAHRDRPPWEACCITHDWAYHLGGPDPDPGKSYAARLAADEALRRCVQATGRARRDAVAEEYGLTPEQVDAAYAAIADSMFYAVRLGGGPCTGLPWRWGYGYPGCAPFE